MLACLCVQRESMMRGEGYMLHPLTLAVDAFQLCRLERFVNL